MKILFIYKYAILGGVTTQLVNRLSTFNKYFECHFAFLNDYGGTSAFNDYTNVYIIKNQYEFNDLIISNKYDILSIIDTNEIYDWIDNLDFNGFIINEVHTTTLNLNKINELKNNKFINLILTPSYYMKNLIENSYGFKSIFPIEVLPNCLDFNKFNYDKYQEYSKEPSILWIGKLDNHKRWNDFIEVCRRLESNYKDYKFNYKIVGGVTANNSVTNTFVRNLIEYNLIEKTTWYPSIKYSDMYKIYSMVRSSGGVYVSTTKNESFGMTILESMSIGLPTIVPNLGAIPELFDKDSKSEFLYTPRNLDMCCKLIIQNLNSTTSLDLSKYTPNKVLDTFLDILNKYIF